MSRLWCLAFALACAPSPPPGAGADAPSPPDMPARGEVPVSSTPDRMPDSVVGRTPDAVVWPQRTDDELDAALEATCGAAVAAGRPVLIVFSAPWCPDCRRMYALEQEPSLAAELANWQRITIDPGRFDRHVPLLQAFGVSKIATWVAARPSDCRLPAPGWSRLREGVFEPKSGQPWTADEIAAWLKSARGA